MKLKYEVIIDSLSEILTLALIFEHKMQLHKKVLYNQYVETFILYNFV